MVATSGGLVRFGRLPNEAYAPAGAAPAFCAGALAMRIHWDLHLIDWGSTLEIGGIVGLVLLALSAIIDRSLTRRMVVLSIAAFVAAVYGTAMVILADVHLDRSAAQKFQSRILSSRISRGKATSYFMTLAPWGPQQNANEILVSEMLFDRLTPGALACIGLYDGALGIRWYSLNLCAPDSRNDPFGPVPRLTSPQ
jgi:hypothetical protein